MRVHPSLQWADTQHPATNQYMHTSWNRKLKKSSCRQQPERKRIQEITTGAQTKPQSDVIEGPHHTTPSILWLCMCAFHHWVTGLQHPFRLHLIHYQLFCHVSHLLSWAVPQPEVTKRFTTKAKVKPRQQAASPSQSPQPFLFIVLL